MLLYAFGCNALLLRDSYMHGQVVDTMQIFQAYLDKSTPFTAYRWAGTGLLFVLFAIRILVAEGWYIGMRLPHDYPACELSTRILGNQAAIITATMVQEANFHSRILARNLPPEPLPRLYITQV